MTGWLSRNEEIKRREVLSLHSDGVSAWAQEWTFRGREIRKGIPQESLKGSAIIMVSNFA
jgi:hypothetical protein